MEESSYLEQIEAYFDQSMPAARRREFERKIEQDAQLKKEFEAYQAALNALEMLAADSLTGKEEPESDVRRIPLWRAAAAVFVLGLLGLLLFANIKYNDQRLAANYYVAPLVDQVQRGSGANLDPAWVAFGRKQYEEAISIFESNRNSLTNQDWFYLAHAYYQVGNSAAALAALENVKTGTTGTKRAEKDWLLALIHLNQKDPAAAKETLQTVATAPDHPKKEDATKLLKQMQSPWRKLVLF